MDTCPTFWPTVARRRAELKDAEFMRIMGGFGNGRYSYSSGPTCESAPSIDLAWLRRRGMLKPGVYSLAWSFRASPPARIRKPI